MPKNSWRQRFFYPVVPKHPRGTPNSAVFKPFHICNRNHAFSFEYAEWLWNRAQAEHAPTTSWSRSGDAFRTYTRWLAQAAVAEELLQDILCPTYNGWNVSVVADKGLMTFAKPEQLLSDVFVLGIYLESDYDFYGDRFALYGTKRHVNMVLQGFVTRPELRRRGYVNKKMLCIDPTSLNAIADLIKLPLKGKESMDQDKYDAAARLSQRGISKLVNFDLPTIVKDKLWVIICCDNQAELGLAKTRCDDKLKRMPETAYSITPSAFAFKDGGGLRFALPDFKEAFLGGPEQSLAWYIPFFPSS